MKLTNRQIFWIVIGVLALLTPLWIYIWHLAQNGISGKPEHWGQFGDFIGGILNPIIGLLTLIVTIIIAVALSNFEKKRHDDAVKPYFKIGTGHFFSANISVIGLTVEQDYYTYKPPQNPAGPHDHFNNQFQLKLFNKGLGIATDVLITFEINLDELRQLLTINHQNITVSATSTIIDEDGINYIWLNVASNTYNYQGNIRIWSIERYGLGTVENRKKVKTVIPSQIMSAFKLYNLKRRLNIKVGDFPTIFATFSYKNIHGTPLNAKFRIGLFPIQDFAHYSLFKILAEPI